jgi:hypothetical protein
MNVSGVKRDPLIFKFYYFQHTQPSVRPQFMPGPQYMQPNSQAPPQQIYYTGMPPMTHGQPTFTFAQSYPGYHPGGPMPMFSQPHMAQMQQQQQMMQQSQQQPTGLAPTGQPRPITITSLPSQGQGQPPLTISPHTTGLPPNTMIPASLPSQIMFPAHQISQPAARPPLPRLRSKAIKIVDPTTQCEIDLSAAKPPATETTAKVSSPDEAVSEVNKLKEIFLDFWLNKSTLHYKGI